MSTRSFRLGGLVKLFGGTYIGDTDNCDVHVMIRIEDKRSGKVYRQAFQLNERDQHVNCLIRGTMLGWARQVAGLLKYRRLPQTTAEGNVLYKQEVD